MKDIRYLPADYDALHVCKSTNSLLTPEFNRHLDYDVLVLPRTLYGDFNGLANEISKYLQLDKEGSEEFTFESLSDLLPNLSLTASQKIAAEEIKKDLFLSKALTSSKPKI